MANSPVTGAIDVVGEQAAAARDLDPAASALRRRRVVVEGVVTEVTFPPVTDAPRYRAVLSIQGPWAGGSRDAAVELLWHGQRSVPGIMAGTRLRCLAMVCFPEGVPTMYNPRYEIIAAKRVAR